LALSLKYNLWTGYAFYEMVIESTDRTIPRKSLKKFQVAADDRNDWSSIAATVELPGMESSWHARRELSSGYNGISHPQVK
jgi:hypothetical protein